MSKRRKGKIGASARLDGGGQKAYWEQIRTRKQREEQSRRDAEKPLTPDQQEHLAQLRRAWGQKRKEHELERKQAEGSSRVEAAEGSSPGAGEAASRRRTAGAKREESRD